MSASNRRAASPNKLEAAAQDPEFLLLLSAGQLGDAQSPPCGVDASALVILSSADELVRRKAAFKLQGIKSENWLEPIQWLDRCGLSIGCRRGTDSFLQT